ncbi:MAG: M1 family aminopeptidase [Bacteroidota bacterium]
MKTIITSAFAFSLLLFSNPLQAQNPRTTTHFYEPDGEPRERMIDVEKMRLEVSFKERESIVLGRVTHIFSPLRRSIDSLFFDAPKINIKKAFLNGRSADFKTDSNGVTVFLKPALAWNSRDSITFEYEATPRKGIYFIGWNDPNNLSRKQIWTQGQQFDNRYWIPMYDDANDKMLTETVVTFLKDYSVLSNGTLLKETDNGNGTKTWYYAMQHPHAGYLLMLGIGKYAIDKRVSKSGVPVNLWYYPEFPEQMEPSYRYSTEAIDFLEEQTGIAYPWESYSQIPVQDFMFGAMENTTATVFGDFFLTDKRGFLDRNYIGVNVHELTHQWFGDYVTARDIKHQWLQESFATFYPKLFSRKYFGEDEYQWNRRGEHNGALAASKTNLLPIVHTEAGGARIYGKGSAVLGMMMYTFGEEEFKRAITHYLKRFPYKNVETNDLYLSFQDTLGITAEKFFDQWLYRGGEPNYDVSYNDFSLGANRETRINVLQTHTVDALTPLFEMPVVFEVHYADGTKDFKREVIKNQAQTVSVANPKGKQIAFVLFDPGSYILKTVTFKKPFKELREQALKAPNMIDRYDAVAALRDADSTFLKERRDLLIQLFDREKFYGIRMEIISQLLKDSTDAARNVLKKAMRDANAGIRKSVINDIAEIPQALLPDVENLLKDSSYAIIETALEKLSTQYPQNVERYLDNTKAEVGANNRVRIKWLEVAARQGDNSAFKKLVDFTSNSYEFRTRTGAMDALKRLNYLDDDLAENLIDAALNPNTRLSGPAVTTAKYFSEQFAGKQRFKKHLSAKNWKRWQDEILKPITQ